MALQTIQGGVWLGEIPSYNGTALIAASNALMDASGERIAFIFQAPKSGTLDRIEWRTGSVTFNAASRFRISLQALSASKTPDETPIVYRILSSLTAAAWQDNGGPMTTDGSDTLANRTTITAGNWYAVVFDYTAFTATTSVYISCVAKTTWAGGINVVPLSYNGSAWGAIGANVTGLFALKYSDGTYEAPLGSWPFASTVVIDFNNESTPDERGLYFQIPFAARLRGAFIMMDVNALGRAFDILLYQDGTSSPIYSQSFTGDEPDLGNNDRGYLFWFNTGTVLSINTNYRLVVKPTEVSPNSIMLNFFTVNTAAIMNCFPCGENWHSTSRSDGGSWSQTTTSRPFMALYFDQLSDNVGSGGGIVKRAPRMLGV